MFGYHQVLDSKMEIWCNDEEVYEKVKITAYPDRRMIPSKDFIFLGFNV